ncbi:unnamed protein product [Xylocopa violacea]|uniref:Uncharacterized protein n=1 Tax=Xylocopa violacea TaxID=135666 RepID=A0ABP1NEV7_XYLVO
MREVSLVVGSLNVMKRLCDWSKKDECNMVWLESSCTGRNRMIKRGMIRKLFYYGPFNGDCRMVIAQLFNLTKNEEDKDLYRTPSVDIILASPAEEAKKRKFAGMVWQRQKICRKRTVDTCQYY